MKELQPFCHKNLSIGLLGGTFDPPHHGHFAIAKDALQRFYLDYLWWIVTPQNNFKAKTESSFLTRIAWCKDIIQHEPKMLVSSIEQEIHSVNTIDLLIFLQSHCPNNYTWIMGSDVLPSFHKWPDWKKITTMVKIAVYDRPGTLFKDIKDKVQIEVMDLSDFKKAAHPPACTIVHDVLCDISSTELRTKGTWPKF